MLIVNRSRHSFPVINKKIDDILWQISMEKKEKSRTKFYLVSKKFSRTVRIKLEVGCDQDDHNKLFYFSMGNDLDKQTIDFNFYTTDIAAILEDGNECFILLRD